MRKKVLITVVTYPLPSRSHHELVCTAGVLEDGSWIRIYPVPLTFLKGLRKGNKIQSYKYTWIELGLKKRTDDFRPESHSPLKYDFSDIEIFEKIETNRNWAERKKYCLSNVYDDLTELIEDSKAPKNVSLATFKPAKILDFIIEEDDRDWKPEWKEQLKQLSLFNESADGKTKELIPKVPYKFFYKFTDVNGRESRLMIEDWEIGALYWNCLRAANGDENEALVKVREMYQDNFLKNKDIYLFLGTTKQWHMRRARNPFVIIGVFYPKKESQMSLF